MIHITLTLSAGLLCILKDAGRPQPETIRIQVKNGTTIRQILISQGINPLLVPMVAVNQKKQDLDAIPQDDAVVTLYGPLAGG